MEQQGISHAERRRAQMHAQLTVSASLRTDNPIFTVLEGRGGRLLV